MKMFENAKVGDRVWDIRFGWGKIIEVDKDILDPYAIKVKFDNEEMTYYDADGYYNVNDINPTLFWNEFEIPEEVFKRPLPKLEIDTKVLVKNNGDEKWNKKHFAGWTDDGRIKCWFGGCTSWSTYGKKYHTIWNFWKLPEDKKDEQKTK